MKLLVIFLTLLSNGVQSQDLIEESSRECEQFEKVIDFIINDSETVKYHRINSPPKITFSSEVIKSGYTYVTRLDLISADLNISSDSLLLLDIDSLYKLTKLYEDRDNEMYARYRSQCLASIETNKRPNIKLIFARYNENLLIVTTGKIVKPNVHNMGWVCIFKFNKDNSFDVKRISYVE